MGSGLNAALVAAIVVLSGAVLVPQHAFSTISFSGYSNSTNIINGTGSSGTNGNGTHSTGGTSGTNGTSSTNGTGSGSTNGTSTKGVTNSTSTSSTSGTSTGSTNSTSAGGTKAPAGTNGTSTQSGTTSSTNAQSSGSAGQQASQTSSQQSSSQALQSSTGAQSQVQAQNSTSPVGQVPGPPQDLVTLGGQGRVSLAWAPPESGAGQVSSYDIYRSTEPGAEALLSQVGNVTSYLDESVSDGQTYYYFVTASGALGQSARSDEQGATPSGTVDQVSRNGLVGEWNFEGTAADTSGAGNNGTARGGTYVPGHIGEGLQLDGVSSYVDIPNSPTLNFGDGSFAISAWLRVGTNSSGWVVDHASNNDGVYAGPLISYRDGIVRAFVRDSSDNWVDLASTSDIGDGQFHHILFMLDRADQTARLYVDGEIQSVRPTSSLGNTDTGLDLKLGGTTYPDTPDGFLGGVIDQVRVYDRALADSEIGALLGEQQAANSGTAPTAQGLAKSLYLAADQQYYAYGDVVTTTAYLPGMPLQEVAFAVSDTTGTDILSRTVPTDANGTAKLQFKVPTSFATGEYRAMAAVSAGGRNYTNSTAFNVIKTHGISVDSVRLVDQQGSPVSYMKRGQNNFVEVSISSGETMPVLLTMNLFDANQSSMGTASIRDTVQPGDSQMTLSFFIPPGAQAGPSQIFADAYSDWPALGGTPVAPESCLQAQLADPSSQASFGQPSSCTSQRLQNMSGTTLSASQSPMTDAQATVTLGVAVSNDSMTFMSPTQAHLLALAYLNGTAPAGQKSLDLVSLNLADLNSTSQAVSNFTTLVGPALQNDPMAKKILQEIEVSKRQVANIIGNETAARINDELVQKQRPAAASQLKADLSALEQSGASSSPGAAYSAFLATVPDNRTQQVFQGEFDFMHQRVAAADAAMQQVLSGGGSLDQAVSVFDRYAAISHAQVVQMNQNLNVEYGLADPAVQSCFDSNGDLPMVNGSSPCLAQVESNSTGQGILITSVQPSDQNGNPVSLLARGQGGFVKVDLYSSLPVPTLVTINMFDSNLDTLGTSSAKYTLSPGRSEVVLPYYVPSQATAGLASIYADALSGWPNSGGTAQSHEVSYFVGLS